MRRKDREPTAKRDHGDAPEPRPTLPKKKTKNNMDAQRAIAKEAANTAGGRTKGKRRPIAIDVSKDLWISPRFNLRGKDGDRAWSPSGNLPPGAGARLLELADIALGNKKSAPTAEDSLEALAHTKAKREPYSL